MFLELYTALARSWRLGPGSPETVAVFTSIVEHREQFLGNYRGLKVLDSGIRTQLRQDIRAVRAGTRQPAPEIFQPVIQRVEDRLLELLGSYQKHVINLHQQQRQSNHQKPSKTVL